MTFFIFDKEKQRYSDDIFDYRLARIKLYQTPETVTIAVVSEDCSINQEEGEADHHQHSEPPDFFEINLENKTYSNK